MLRFLTAGLLLTVSLVPAVSLGDATIVLDLSSPEPPPTRHATRDTARSRRLPSRHSDPRSEGARENVIGRLGVASRAATIRAYHSSRSRTMVQVPAGTYLALTSDAGDWYGVLMSDRSTGWIHRSAVQILQYEVVSPDAPRSTTAADASAATEGQLLTAGQRTLLQVAYSYLGLPYRYGGENASGIDCSAFVQQCFGALGVRLPRTAAEQSLRGMPVTQDQLQAGDRLYFAARDGRVSHTGIYIGNTYFIHASSTHRGVAISKLTESLYARMYAGARR